MKIQYKDKILIKVMLLISQLNFIILLFTFLMPLCKPEVFGYNCHSCWTELASSDFLTFEQCVECDNFRIYLSHNGFVIGIASENDEAKDLWKDCLRISQLAKSGNHLLGTFESLYEEYEDQRQDEQATLSQKKIDLKLWSNIEEPSSNELTDQERHIIIQLVQLITQNNEFNDEHNLMLLRAIQSSTESSSNIDISFEPNDLLVGFKHPDSDKLFAQNLTSFGVVSISSIQIITDCIDLSKPLNQPLEEILTSPRGDEELIDKHKEIGSLRGWLEKRGFWLSKDWKRRWFSLDLEKARLYYYRYPEEESSNNYRGFIDLSEVTTVHETFIPGSSAIGEWRFEIHTPKRVWFLRASRKQEMEMWMFQLNQLSLIWDKLNPKDKKLNVNVLTNDLRIDTSTSTPGINTKPARLSVGDPKIEKENVHTFKCRSHIKPPPPAPKFEPDDFSQFGAPYGEEISNKDTILSNIDRRLGHRFPPDVEYIYVEPYLNYASKSVYLTANPYGHSAIRYTLPDTKEQLVMNIVGLADHELVNFLSPEDFFFSTNFDTKIGNEQGGIYNRNFASIRIQRVPPEKILAMHQYFLDLHSRSHTHWADYNIALGPLLNRTGVVSYGNCAHWASQGLRQAGLMKNPSMFPKAIWIDLFEELKKNCQHEQYSNNVSVVYYKRILHAKRFYGEDADWTGWGRPSDFFKKKTYENLEPFADVIVTVPSGSKKAILQTGSKSSLEKLEKKFQNLKQEGLSTIELRFDIHVEPRILFNEIFYTRIDARTLQKTKVNTELLTQDNPVKFFGCGFPIYSNSWMVDINDNLHRTYSKSKNVSDITWIKTEYPILSDTSIDIINCKCTQIAPNEDGSCWIIYGGYLFYRLENDEKWTEVSSPSDYHVKHIATVNMKEGVWVLDTQRKLYHWTLESSSWLSFPNTPKLDVIATGTNSELWGLTNEYKVYRRINSIDGNHWIQLHGALLKSIAVASSNEVWGIDPDGRIYIWSVDKSNELSEDIDSEITIVPSRMRWQSLGNILPISSIQVSSKSIPWAVSEYDPGYIYKISSHRLLVLSIKSARKIWDDKETGCKPFDIGFYRPLPPENFYSLGDIAERSHLENSQTEALVVCEVGKQPDELSILSKPIGFKRVFSIKNKDAKSGCFIWRPLPPEGYLAFGDLVTTSDTPPDSGAVRCIHKNFINLSEACNLSSNKKFLWTSKDLNSNSYISIWLVKPRLDSLWCNVFLCGKGDNIPSVPMACLKLSAAR